MTILKALKNFITKSGGTTKAETIAEAINDMPVGGSGNETLVVRMWRDDDNPNRWRIDKTAQEIYDAYPNVIVICDTENGSRDSVTYTVFTNSYRWTYPGEENYNYQFPLCRISANKIINECIYFQMAGPTLSHGVDPTYLKDERTIGNQS